MDAYRTAGVSYQEEQPFYRHREKPSASQKKAGEVAAKIILGLGATFAVLVTIATLPLTLACLPFGIAFAFGAHTFAVAQAAAEGKQPPKAKELGQFLMMGTAGSLLTGSLGAATLGLFCIKAIQKINQSRSVF